MKKEDPADTIHYESIMKERGPTLNGKPIFEPEEIIMHPQMMSAAAKYVDSEILKGMPKQKPSTQGENDGEEKNT